MELCKNDPCQTYTPIKKAKYVLEINKGFLNKYNFTRKDKLYFKY